MNELHKLFSGLFRIDKETIISGIIKNEEALHGKKSIHTIKESGSEPEVYHRSLTSIQLVELGSKEMLEINLKQEQDETAKQVHYAMESVGISVDCKGLTFSLRGMSGLEIATTIFFE